MVDTQLLSYRADEPVVGRIGSSARCWPKLKFVTNLHDRCIRPCFPPPRELNMGWRVGPLQDVRDDNKHFAGSGFVLHDDHDRPCVTFGFTSREEASAGAKKMWELVALSKEIMRARPDG